MRQKATTVRRYNREDIHSWYTTINTTTLSMKSTPVTLDNILTHTPALDHITFT